MEKKVIPGLDKWAVDPALLKDAQVVTVLVKFKRPPLEEVIAFPDLKDRLRFSRQYIRQQLKPLLRQLGVTTYELVGGPRRYWAFRYQTTLGQLCAQLDESLIDQVWIHALEGLAEKADSDESREQYFCLTLLFQVQVEGLRPYTQKYDEQVVLIKACSVDQAKEKLQSVYIPDSETPFLNSDLQLVRWKFVEFLVYDQLSVHKDWEAHMQEGLEVISSFFAKRWSPVDYWDGIVKAPESENKQD
jgi:hypothetical protein